MVRAPLATSFKIGLEHARATPNATYRFVARGPRSSFLCQGLGSDGLGNEWHASFST